MKQTPKFNIIKSFVCWILGKYFEGFAANLEVYPAMSPTFTDSHTFILHTALECYHRCKILTVSNKDDDERVREDVENLKKIDEKISVLAQFAKEIPLHHYKQYYHFALAERARALQANHVQGPEIPSNSYCHEQYELAIREASEGNLFIFEAAFSEALGTYALAHNEDDLAKQMLTKAYSGYRTWGATRKLREMRDIFGEDYLPIQEAKKIDALRHESIIGVCISGKTDTLKDMFKYNLANIYSSDENGNSCVHIAAANGNASIIGAFFSGVDAMLPDRKEIKDRFLSGKNKSGSTPLSIALSKNFFEVADLLQALGADINEKSTFESNTALHRACRTGDSELLGYLLRQPALRPMIRNKNGDTALIVAAKSRQNDAFRTLLEFMVKTKPTSVAFMKDNNGYNLMHIAVDTGFPALVRMLAEYLPANLQWVWAEMLTGRETRSFSTPLSLALAFEQEKVAGEILKQAKKLTEDPGSSGTLHFVQQQDAEQDTALHIALRKGFTDLAAILVRDFNANTTVKNRAKETPAALAKKIGFDLEKIQQEKMLGQQQAQTQQQQQQPQQQRLAGLDKMELDEVLEHPEACAALREQCMRELSLENLDFLLEIKKFERLTDDKERLDMAINIYNSFVKEGSERELNVERRLRRDLRGVIFPLAEENDDSELASDENEAMPLPNDVFRNLSQAVKKNLGDTLMRLIRA